MDVNRKLSDALKIASARHCRWTRMQLTSIASNTEVEDNSLAGKASNVSVGQDAVASCSVRGSLGSADGSVPMSDAKDVAKYCPGINHGYMSGSR